MIGHEVSVSAPKMDHIRQRESNKRKALRRVRTLRLRSARFYKSTTSFSKNLGQILQPRLHLQNSPRRRAAVTLLSGSGPQPEKSCQHKVSLPCVARPTPQATLPLLGTNHLMSL